ncbi:MAG: homoaconitate hydratase [Methanobacteriota archaeon]|nr:MAG: homoaconitate hydratase [Euryarchaeota archaeon]
MNPRYNGVEICSMQFDDDLESLVGNVGDRKTLGEIRLVDTTCRDGEQMPGISFNCDEKLAIAGMLDEIHVEQLETFATYNESDRRCARLLSERSKNISIMGWNRLVKKDVEDSLASDVDAVSVSTDTSDLALRQKLKMTRGKQIEKLIDCVEFAKSHGLYVCFNAGDATRTDVDYLVRFAQAGKDAGGDRFRICDTIGILTPSSSFKLIETVMSNVDIDIEFHAHNDFGLAVANALAACEAAAPFEDRALWVSTTINGLGERAGNVPLEVFVMNLHSHYGVDKYETMRILSLAKLVEAASGQPIPLNYPVVGGNIFTHKSGIHVDGVLKNPKLYEAIDPEKIGATRKIALGKHSGKAAIKYRLDQLDLTADSEAIEQLRLEINRIAENRKSDLTDDDFMELYSRVVINQEGKERDLSNMPETLSDSNSHSH